jgi:hypothetical protein
MYRLVMSINESIDMQETKGNKKILHEEAFSLYKNKFLSCHDSIADPEKPGRA